MKAIIEAIESKKVYDIQIAKNEEKLNDQRKALQKLQGGIITFSMRLSRKGPDHHLQKISNEILETENELKSLYSVNLVIASQLINIEIPKFKQEKVYRFENVLRSFASENIQEVEYLINQLRQIEESLNY